MRVKVKTVLFSLYRPRPPVRGDWGLVIIPSEGHIRLLLGHIILRCLLF